MTRRRALQVTLGITVALLALVAGLRVLYPWYLAVHWRNRLDTVPKDRVAILLESVARLGDPGIPVLVEALGSEREEVATGGRQVLEEEIRRWETLRARAYSPKLATLARALADRIERFGPGARTHAAELASQILRLWTLDENVVDPTEVIACCEKVLRATRAQRPLWAELPGQGEPGREHPAERWAEQRPGLRLPGDGSRAENASLQGLAALPGSELPVETLPARRLPAEHSDAPRLANASLNEPGHLNGPGKPKPLKQLLNALSQPDPSGAISDRAQSDSDPAAAAASQPLRPLGFTGQSPGAASDGRGGLGGPAQLAGVATVELMRCLGRPNDRTAAAARTELAHRGFTETQLALARQMFDPDPNVRMRLARVLTELPGVDPVPWLLQLSRDEDAEVRLSAITLMATTADPAILQAMETIARHDADPRVRRQAEQIARSRRQRRY